MISKKSNSANLENKRMIFLEIGLIIALGVALAAFEWKSIENPVDFFDEAPGREITQEKIIQTSQEIKKIPPKPIPFSSLNIVDDQVELDDQLNFTSEADESTEIPEYIFEEPEENADPTEKIPFHDAQIKPSFPGGETARLRYLQQNVNYPVEARERGIQGTVFVAFVVEKDGSISDVKIIRGIRGGCDEEALRVTRNMPDWNPGYQRSKPVRVQYHMPIRFTLR